MCSTSYSSRVCAIFSYVLKVVSYQSFLRLHCYHLTRVFGYSKFVRSSVVGLFNISDSGDIKCDLPKFVSLILSCALLVIAKSNMPRFKICSVVTFQKHCIPHQAKISKCLATDFVHKKFSKWQQVISI